MSFKEYMQKKIMPTYFMVVTLLNLGMFILGTVFFSEMRFGYDAFFSPLLFGLIGCIPSLLDYLFQEKKTNQVSIIAQSIFELVVLEVCVLGTAKLAGLIDSMLTAVIIACMVLVIFVVVWALQYLQDNQLCDKMNEALSQHKDQN